MSLPPDEFSLLAENAAEFGLPWTGPPAVERRELALAGGGSLSALVWGEGPPGALLVHGSAQNAHTWDTVALALARPVVAVDLPGHGHSSWRSEHDYSPSVLAGVLAEAAEALAPDAGLVVGMSLGGLASIALAGLRPDLVRSLLLVDITPGVNAEKSSAVTAFTSGPERFASFDAILERTVLHNPGRSEASLRRGVVHNAHQLPDGSWAWRWDPHGRNARASSASTSTFGPLWDILGATSMPLALARGGRSPVVDDADVDELLARRPDAEVIVVEGAGHSIQGDRPVELAEIVAARLGARGGGPGAPADR